MERKNKNTDITLFGKVVPHVKDIEKAVIGICLLEKNAFLQASIIVKHNHFYADAHQRIFRAMEEMDQLGQHIDLLTVGQKLSTTSELQMIGGAYYLTVCTDGIVSSAHLEQHCLIILEKFMQREYAALGQELYTRAVSGIEDFKSLNALITERQDKLWENIHGFSSHSYAQLVFKRLGEILSNDGSKPPGLMTLFPSLDRILNGIIAQLYIIAARPSMGKTAFMVQLVENFSKQVPVGAIELETSANTYIDRHLANKSGINSGYFRKGGLEQQQVEKLHSAAEDIINQKIYTLFDPDQDIISLISTIRQWILKYGIGVVLLDYVQIVKNAEEHERLTREQQVAKVIYALQRVSVKLGIPVIVLAQLSREVAKRTGHRPQLSDLRESGALEAAARCVIFLHRPEYYGEMEDDQGYSLAGVTEVIVAKHNEGDIGDARLKLDKATSKFTDMAFDPGSLGTNGTGGYKPLNYDAF